MLRVLISLLLASAPLLAMAQSAVPDRAGIEEAIRHYFAANDERDPKQLGLAFHPGTIMFWADTEGRLQSLDQNRWKARLADRAQAIPVARERRILWIDQSGDGASAEALSHFDDFQFRDYLTLLRIEGRWRIVGKVFVRQSLADAAADSKAADARGKQEIEALIRRKLAAMDANDGGLLASAYLPQAQTATLEDGELVAWPIAEWSARFDRDAAADTRPQGVERRIERIETAGNVGWARFTHHRSGRVVVDYALLVRSGGLWRIAHLDYLVARATPSP